MLVAIPGSGGHVGLAHFFLCLSSFVKDCGMAASWSTAIDIGHRYSPTVAGFMNTVGNLSQVIAVPVVAWLAMLAGSAGAIRTGELVFRSTQPCSLWQRCVDCSSSRGGELSSILRPTNRAATEGWQGRICLEGDRKRHAQR
jgi:hypothetical protein